MKANLMLAIFTIALSTQTIKSLNPPLGLSTFFYFQQDFLLFNLKPLAIVGEQTWKEDVRITIKNETVDGKLKYNFGYVLDYKKYCKNEVPSSNVLLMDSSSKCYPLILNDRKLNTFEFVNKIKPDKKKEEGFFIKSNDAEFKVVFLYNKEKSETSFDKTAKSLVLEDPHFLGIIDKISEFTNNHKFVVPLVIVFFGLILLFFGGVKWQQILGFSGFVFGVLAVLGFFYLVVDFKSSTTSFIIIGVLAVVIGALTAFLTYNSAIISYIIIGFPSGYFLASVCLILIFKLKLEDWVMYMIEVGSGIVVALFCAFLGKKLMVLLTSIIGSILATFYFAFMIGQIEDLRTIINLIVYERKMVT